MLQTYMGFLAANLGCTDQDQTLWAPQQLGSSWDDVHCDPLSNILVAGMVPIAHARQINLQRGMGRTTIVRPLLVSQFSQRNCAKYPDLE